MEIYCSVQRRGFGVFKGGVCGWVKVAGSANNSLYWCTLSSGGFNEGMSNIGPQPNNSALLHNTGRLGLVTWGRFSWNLFAKGLSPSKAYDLLNLMNWSRFCEYVMMVDSQNRKSVSKKTNHLSPKPQIMSNFFPMIMMSWCVMVYNIQWP